MAKRLHLLFCLLPVAFALPATAQDEKKEPPKIAATTVFDDYFYNEARGETKWTGKTVAVKRVPSRTAAWAQICSERVASDDDIATFLSYDPNTA